MNLTKFIEDEKSLFDEKVKELNDSSQDLSTDSDGETKEFGYKTNVNDWIYTTPDWSNIKTYIHQSHLRLIAAVVEMIEKLPEPSNVSGDHEPCHIYCCGECSCEENIDFKKEIIAQLNQARKE